MNRYDVSVDDIGGWFDAEADGPVPGDVLARAVAMTATRRPRSRRVAWLGSHWTPREAGHGPVLSLAHAGRRMSLAVLLLLAMLAIIGAAALIGGLRPEPPATTGRLAYDRAGDIYLADADGSHPRIVADGRSGSSYSLIDGTIWAPDGRHFVYYDEVHATAHVSDADGAVIASFPWSGWRLAWSPDSTRLAAFPSGGRVEIYRIDGVPQDPLPLPDGYDSYAEYLPTWAGDSRSLYLAVAPAGLYGPGEVWQLYFDGSPPRAVPRDDPRSALNARFSRDGRMVAFSGTPPIDPTAPPVPDWLLSVADADGSDARPVIDADRVGTLHQGTGGGNPRWSPSGAHIAYVALRGGEIFDIRVVDVATGVVTTVLGDHREGGWPSYSWSAAGDRILYTAPGVPSLWSVDVTGQDRRLLVAGARSGEWQWDPPVSP